MQARKIRVLIVDDSCMMRDSLQQMISLESDMTVVDTACDGLEALRKTRQHLPDIILMDYNMPVCNGKEVIPRIKSRFPAQKILVFTVCIDSSEIIQIFRLGAQGYLPKSSSITEVFSAIRRVYAGEAVIPSHIATVLVDEFRRKYASHFELRSEESRIMHLVGDGISSSEVAYRLFIPEKDVNRTMKRFLEILQTELRAEAEETGRRHKLE